MSKTIAELDPTTLKGSIEIFEFIKKEYLDKTGIIESRIPDELRAKFDQARATFKRERKSVTSDLTPEYVSDNLDLKDDIKSELRKQDKVFFKVRYRLSSFIVFIKEYWWKRKVKKFTEAEEKSKSKAQAEAAKVQESKATAKTYQEKLATFDLSQSIDKLNPETFEGSKEIFKFIKDMLDKNSISQSRIPNELTVKFKKAKRTFESHIPSVLKNNTSSQEEINQNQALIKDIKIAMENQDKTWSKIQYQFSRLTSSIQKAWFNRKVNKANQAAEKSEKTIESETKKAEESKKQVAIYEAKLAGKAHAPANELTPLARDFLTEITAAPKAADTAVHAPILSTPEAKSIAQAPKRAAGARPRSASVAPVMTRIDRDSPKPPAQK